MKISSILTTLIITFTLFLFTFSLSGQDIIISEILASNHTINYDKDYYAFSDWIELYNSSDVAVNITGYWLSDNSDNKKLWRINKTTYIPAKSFLLIWADGQNTFGKEYHTSFKLDKDGGGVFLTDNNGNVVDSLEYKQQKTDISYGKTANDLTKNFFFDKPTPSKLNPETGYESSERSFPPEFSTRGGVYNHDVTLYLTSPVSGAVIHYTDDGSMPDDGSKTYDSPIILDSSTAIRAIAFENGKLKSQCITNTYIINENTTLPVISISMNDEFFWDDSIGFYVEGVNGLTGNETGYGPSPKSNFNRNWRRPMHIEFYDEDLKPAFSADGEVKVYGGWSRGAVVKSLAVYPDSPIDYKLFNEKPFTKYESFIIRNAGNEWARTKLRDAILQSVTINQTDIDLQANRPAVLFINGKYWGVYNIREKINEDYVKTNHGYDQDNLDFIESYRTVKSGDMTHYNNMMNFLNNHSLANNDNYEYIKTQMDVYECMNYFMTGIYSGHGDWIYNNNNNLRIWRPRTATGKWRWLLYDTDGSYYSESKRGIADAINKSFHLSKLMENKEAREYFIKTFSAMLNNAFAPERAVHYIDSLKALIAPEMARHIEKWKNTDENGNPAVWKTPGAEGYIQGDDGYGGPCLYSYDQWERFFSTMYSVARARPGVLLEELRTYFDLGDKTEISFDVSGDSAGVIEVNDVLVLSYNKAQTYFKGQTISVTAQPKYGYKFLRWIEKRVEVKTFISKNDTWRYLDNGSDQGTAWTSISFNDDSWKSGTGELGYGDGNESTTINYGPDSQNKYITTYFRKSFTVDSTGMNMSGTINLLIDDGAVIYLNGTEIARYNMAPGTITNTTFASSAIGGANETTYKTIDLPKDILRYGNNVIAVEVHQCSKTSSDISFDMELTVRTIGKSEIISSYPGIDFMVDSASVLFAEFAKSDTEINLHINEFVASNRASNYDNEGQSADWIEIYNSGDYTIDMAGMYVTDDLDKPLKCKIQDNGSDSTKVPPGGFIVFYADGNIEQGVLHLNFRLDGDGEQIGLSELIAHEPVYYDTISFGPQIMDISYGRYPDGTGAWQTFEKATPGEANIIYEKESVSGLFINEIMAYDGTEPDGTSPDWIEIYNSNDDSVDIGGLFISDNPDNLVKCRIPSVYPDSTTIPSKGYLVLTANKKASESILNLNFKLNDEGEELSLVQLSNGSTRYIDYFSFGQQSNKASYGRYPDGSSTIQVLSAKTPGESNTNTNSIHRLIDYKVSVFPNPSDGIFFLKLDHKSAITCGDLILKVYDSAGKLILIKTIPPSFAESLTEKIDLSDYRNGLYLIQIISGNGFTTIKLNKN